MTAPFKHFFIACVALVCAYASVSSSFRANADANIIDINGVISSWLVNEITFDELSERLDLINSASFDLPQLSSAQARVFHNCSRGLGTCRQIDTAYSSEADLQYKLAIEQRPHWAENHVGLAQLKADQLIFDDDFHSAFAAGVQYGKYEASTIVRLSKIALAHWTEFSIDQRQRNIEIIRVGLMNKRRFVKQKVVDDLVTATESYPKKLDPQLLRHLNLWLAAENSLKADERIKLILSFWPHWKGEAKFGAINTLMLISNKYGVQRSIGVARKIGKIAILCAVLPRSNTILKVCTDKRLKR